MQTFGNNSFNTRDDHNFSWVVDNRLAGCRIPLNGDDVQFLKEQGVDVLIRVVERHLAGVPRSLLEQFGIEEHLESVVDFTAPSQEQIHSILDFLGRSIAEGRRVAVSCRGGRGRTGTILACALVMNGYSAEEAIAEIRRLRPTSVEPGEQEVAIETFASTVNDHHDLHKIWPGHLLRSFRAT